MTRSVNRGVNGVLIVGGGGEYPEIEYATGFRATDAVALLRMNSRQCLVVPNLEYGRALRCAERKAGRMGGDVETEVFTAEMLGVAPRRRGRLGEWAVALLRREGLQRIRVPGRFPFGVAQRLQAAGIRVTVSRDELFPEREVKSGEEIRCIRQCQQAAVIGMRAAIAMITDSEIDGQGFLRVRGGTLTSEGVRDLIDRTLFEHGCIGRDTIVAGGRQATDPHERGQGPLRAHEAIVMDIFPQHREHGYWGDLTRTVCRGRAGAALRRMFAAVRAAQYAAMTVLKAGVKGATVHGRVVAEFRRRGYENKMEEGRPTGFIHGTGHGVGMHIHESPSLSPAGGWLRTGHVVTVEPGLYYPGIGGIRVEDTIVVTATGWRYLVPCEKRFEV